MQEYKNGDKVIIREEPQPAREIWWFEDMKDTCGKVGTVINVAREDAVVLVAFEGDLGCWSYHYDWISPVGEELVPKTQEVQDKITSKNKYSRGIKPAVDIDAKKHNHYFKECGYEFIDVYRVLQLFDVTDPCIQHAVKKLLVTGNRGFKDIHRDVQDVIDTLERWKEMQAEKRAIEMHNEWNKE